MADRMRGIFPVLQTTVNDDNSLDVESLRSQVDFCIRAGAHGLVYPVLGGEFQFLSDRERHEMSEAVISEADGRVPVVIGVAGTSGPVAAEHARHAAGAGADAVIALPPYLNSGSRDEIMDYYRAVSDAAGITVFIQHSKPGMDPPFLIRLLQELEHVRYIKEEMAPSAHNIGAVVDAVGDACDGVFGGSHGRWMVSEMRRGAAGFMPAAEAVDLHVQTWDAFQSGDEAEARRCFSRHLPLINLIQLLGLRVCKEVLVRRGAIKTSHMRMPGAQQLDDQDHYELDAVLEALKPHLRV